MRPEDRWLFNVLALCVLTALVIALSGCVTLHDCHARINGAVQVGCQWAFSAAP